MPQTAPSPDVVRIILAGVPRLTAALVREYVATQPGVAVVAECRQPDALTALSEDQKIDVVVTMRRSAGIADACQYALFGPRALPVIALVNNGNLETYDRQVLEKTGMDDLMNEIRRVTAK